MKLLIAQELDRIRPGVAVRLRRDHLGITSQIQDD